jgi:hypothetical protein
MYEIRLQANDRSLNIVRGNMPGEWTKRDMVLESRGYLLHSITYWLSAALWSWTSISITSWMIDFRSLANPAMKCGVFQTLASASRLTRMALFPAP